MFNWHEYITQGIELKSDKIDSIFKDVEDLRHRFSPIQDLISTNLLNKNCSKHIIKKKNQDFIAKKTGHNYAFFFQCLSTGRLSKVIPEVRFSEFGILKGEEKTGSNYPDKSDIFNKIEAVENAYYKKFKELMDNIRNERILLEISMPSYKERYYEYLNSQEWKAKRETILERDNYKCVVSNDKNYLHIHHISYDNIGNEEDYDLVTVSKNVHSILHNEYSDLYHKYNYKVESYINSIY